MSAASFRSTHWLLLMGLKNAFCRRLMQNMTVETVDIIISSIYILKKAFYVELPWNIKINSKFPTTKPKFRLSKLSFARVLMRLIVSNDALRSWYAVFSKSEDNLFWNGCILPTVLARELLCLLPISSRKWENITREKRVFVGKGALSSLFI